MANVELGDTEDERSVSFLPLALHFNGAGLVLMGASLIATTVGGRGIVSFSAPLLVAGQILAILGSFFASRRQGVQGYWFARFAMALFGLGLAVVVARLSIEAWLELHARWMLSYVHADRWLFWFGALALLTAMVHRNARVAGLAVRVWPLFVGLGLIAVQVVASAKELTVVAAVWKTRLRAFPSVVELPGALGLLASGLTLFAIGRMMHHAWIEGRQPSARTTKRRST